MINRTKELYCEILYCLKRYKIEDFQDIRPKIFHCRMDEGECKAIKQCYNCKIKFLRLSSSKHSKKKKKKKHKIW